MILATVTLPGGIEVHRMEDGRWQSTDARAADHATTFERTMPTGYFPTLQPIADHVAGQLGGKVTFLVEIEDETGEQTGPQ